YQNFAVHHRLKTLAAFRRTLKSMPACCWWWFCRGCLPLPTPSALATHARPTIAGQTHTPGLRLTHTQQLGYLGTTHYLPRLNLVQAVSAQHGSRASTQCPALRAGYSWADRHWHPSR